MPGQERGGQLGGALQVHLSAGGGAAAGRPTSAGPTRPKSGRPPEKTKKEREKEKQREHGWGNPPPEAKRTIPHHSTKHKHDRHRRPRSGHSTGSSTDDDDDDGEHGHGHGHHVVGGDGRKKKGKRRGPGHLTVNPLEVLHHQAQDDMKLFLLTAQKQLDSALKVVDSRMKRDQEVGRDHYTFSMAVLGELSRVATEAAKAASAAAVTAAAASTAAAAALMGASQLEPMIEQARAPPVEHKKKEAVDDNAPRWGYTSRRASKILKPLGHLESDAEVLAKKNGRKAKKKGAHAAARQIKAEDLDAGTRAALAGTDNLAYDANSYAHKKQEAIQKAKQRRGSNMAVALPQIERKRKGPKKKPSAALAEEDEGDGTAGMGSIVENEDEDGVYHADH